MVSSLHSFQAVLTKIPNFQTLEPTVQCPVITQIILLIEDYLGEYILINSQPSDLGRGAVNSAVPLPALLITSSSKVSGNRNVVERFRTHQRQLTTAFDLYCLETFDYPCIL